MPKHETDMQRMRLSREWLDARDAARELGVQPGHLTDDIRPLITHQSRSLTGARTARGVGYAYSRADIWRCKVIMRELGCKALRAAQILHACRRLRELGLLDKLSELAGQAAELEQRKRRRFQ